MSYPFISPGSVHPADFISQYLTDDGTQSGSAQMTGDYTVATGTPTRFYYQSESSRAATLHRLLISISDSNGILASEYGNLNTALTTGITLDIRDDNGDVILDLMDNRPVQTNGDWGELCYDVALQDWGAGDDYVLVRWTFANAGRSIHLPAGWNIGCSLVDDFTGLIKHGMVLQGFH